MATNRLENILAQAFVLRREDLTGEPCLIR